MDEDTLIKSRLAVDEKALQRLTKRFNQWSTNLFKETDEDFDKGMNAVLLELSHVEAKLEHAQLVAAMTFRERQNYHEEQAQIERQLTLAQQELIQLEQQLEEAKQERSNKIQYDEVANEINQFPTRQQSMQQIAHLREEIGALEGEAQGYNQMLAWRRRQFLAALVSLQGIQESIVEDRKEEERLLALKINQRFENRDGGVAIGAGGLMQKDADSEDEDFDEKVRAQQEQQEQQQPAPLQQQHGQQNANMTNDSVQGSGINGVSKQSGVGDGGEAMEMDAAQEPHKRQEDDEEEEGATFDEDGGNDSSKMAVDDEEEEGAASVTPRRSPSLASSLAGSSLPGTPRISKGTTNINDDSGMMEDDYRRTPASGGDQSSTQPTPSPMGSQIGTPLFGGESSSFEPGDAVGLTPSLLSPQAHDHHQQQKSQQQEQQSPTAASVATGSPASASGFSTPRAMDEN